MKLTILIIFMFVAGTFGNFPPDCYQIEGERCPVSSSFPDEIPETIDDLKRECKEYVDEKRCWLNVYEICEEDADEIAEMRNLFLHLNSTCQEDSHTFKVLSRNFDCLSYEAPIVKKLCHRREFFMTARSAARTKVKELTGDSESEELLNCRLGYQDLICEPTILGEKCGEESGKAAFELIKSIFFGIWLCEKEFPEEWEAIFEVYEATIREQYEMIKMSNERRR